MARFLMVPVGSPIDLDNVALGLVRAFVQKGNQTLYFKPVSSDDQPDASLETAQALFEQKLNQPVLISEFDDLISKGKGDEAIEQIVADFHDTVTLQDKVVVIEGVEADSRRNYLVAQNAKIATALNANVILVVNVLQQNITDIARQLILAAQDYAGSYTQIIGFVLNQYQSTDNQHQYVKQLTEILKAQGLSLPCIGVIKASDESFSVQSKNSIDAPNRKSLIQSIADQFDVNSLAESLQQPESSRLSPASFRYQMMARAQQANKRIVLPEGNEPRTIAAAAICQRKGIARCVLLAERDEVYAIAQQQGIDLPDDLEIIAPESIRARYVDPMVELRKKKGLTPEQAAQQLEDTVVLGTMMLATDEVDGLVSGAVHTTANTIRPALQLIKTAPNASLVSSVFFMLMPEQVLVYGDCAVNPEPTATELADIAIQSADSAKAFGIEPKVAMISYSTGTSGSGAAVEKVKEATALAQAKRPDLPIDGPLQYDAASVPEVGQQKAPNSPVAGEATVFIFPDLNTGNTTYKAVQRSAHVLSVGPMLQGLNKPVNDLSRGALVDDIVYTIAITAIQATQINH